MAASEDRDELQRRQADDDRTYEALANSYYSRFISGPDIWRARASTAAGLLATAAAALLAGLLLREDSPSPLMKAVGGACFVAYVCAVVLFFRASVAPAAKVVGSKEETRSDWFAFVRAQITEDLKLVKRQTAWGARFAMGALLLTLATFIVAMTSETQGRRGQVVLSAEGLEELRQLCPRASATIAGEIELVDADTVRVSRLAGCGEINEADVSRDLVALIAYK